MRHHLVTTTVGIVIGTIGGVILSLVKPKWATAVTYGTVDANTIPPDAASTLTARFSIDPPAPLGGRSATASLRGTGGTSGTLLLSSLD